MTTRKPPASGRIEAIDLQTGTRHSLLEGSTPRLAPTGDLLFERQGRIWATKFNSTRLAVTGTAVAFGESVALNDVDAQFAISRDGSLAYIPAAEQATGSLVWLDRNGTPTPILNEPVGIRYPRLSPDGKHLAASTSGPAPSVRTFDLERGTHERLTFEGNNRRSVWSPSGKQIAFFSLTAAPQEGTTQDLFLVDAAGGTPTRLLERAGPQWPDDWSPDGRFLIFEDGSGGNSRDLWLLPFGQEPRPLVVTRFNERGAVFSPDGRSVAFVSDESGRAEVYVQPFEREGPRTRISVAGGLQPVWGHDRRELFYREGDSLMVVQVQLEPFQASTPRKLIEMTGVLYGMDEFYADYDVGPDGRILAVRQDPRAEIRFVLNWVEELRHALGR